MSTGGRGSHLGEKARRRVGESAGKSEGERGERVKSNVHPHPHPHDT